MNNQFNLNNEEKSTEFTPLPEMNEAQEKFLGFLDKHFHAQGSVDFKYIIFDESIPTYEEWRDLQNDYNAIVKFIKQNEAEVKVKIFDEMIKKLTPFMGMLSSHVFQKEENKKVNEKNGEPSQ